MARVKFYKGIFYILDMDESQIWIHTWVIMEYSELCSTNKAESPENVLSDKILSDNFSLKTGHLLIIKQLSIVEC